MSVILGNFNSRMTKFFNILEMLPCIFKNFFSLNLKLNLLSNDMYESYAMTHMTWQERFFEKWVIDHNSRMESKLQNPKPCYVILIYVDFIFKDQNQRPWLSYEKLSPTFFGTSNFETWLSRDPITWQPEVRCFGYKMTHSIILQPQKNFSRTLQILGFIAESYHCGAFKLKTK